MIKWLKTYKAQLDKVYLKEESQGAIQTASNHRIPTYLSCSECHTKQVDFWQSTSHSLAMTTLIHANEANNPNCIQCHSVGYKQPGGFHQTNQMIVKENSLLNQESYWKDFLKKVPIKHPIRKQNSLKRKKWAKQWLKLDRKLGITQNHANVQCLNCHQQNAEHPFDEAVKTSLAEYQSKCLSCHNQDQSPEWYDKDSKGLATSLNKKYFSKKLKEVSCPKIERN